MDKQILNKGAGLLAVLFVAANVNLVIPVAAEARNIKNNTRTSVNRNVNVSQRNVNVNRNVDIDVDVDRHYHPVARAAATTAAVTTAAVVTSASSARWFAPYRRHARPWSSMALRISSAAAPGISRNMRDRR